MLAELLEICMEPKRINDLQSLTNLFLDQDENESRSGDLNFLGGYNAQQNLENDNQQHQANQPPQIPLPPIPDMFPVQVMQQMNINESYQLPAHPCPYHHHHNESNNASNPAHYSLDGRGSSNSSGPASGTSTGIYSNQRHPFKRNASPTAYSSNYCSLRTPSSNYCNNCCAKGDSYCSSCGFSNNPPSLTSHLSSIISKNLSSEAGWQSELSTVRERNAVLFNSEYMSDITFLVGTEDDDCSEASKEKSITNPTRIFGHKYILGSASAVFYSMLYGGLAEKSSEIRLVDVEPQAFLTLLRYIYTDDICLDSDNVVPTFYAAKKYIIPHLAKACINYLQHTLKPENACILLSQMRLFEEEKEFIDECLHTIDVCVELAFASPSFVHIDEETLKRILQRETLNTKELHIFEACLRWAGQECERRQLEPTAANKRKVLDQIIYLIRIATMSLDDFANGPAQSGVLSAEETAAMFLHYTAKKQPANNVIDKFNFKKRRGLDLYEISRFRSSKSHPSQWRYRESKCDSIQFSVDKKIFLVGLSVFGSYSICSVYNIKMELKRNDRVLAHKTTQLVSDGTSRTFPLTWDNPIEIRPNQLYTTSVTLEGTGLSYYGQEGLAEVIWSKEDRCVTFDFQCSPESQNGTGVQGGQIPSLLFYFPSLDSELVNRNANALEDGRETGDSALGCK